MAEFEKECANISQRRSDFEKNISQAKKDLEKISKKVNESEKLQQEGSTRDEYLKIKTDIQVKNAQIERERSKLEA